MLQEFKKLENYIVNDTIKINNKGLNKTIASYSYHYYSKNDDFSQMQLIYQYFKESKVIVIDYYSIDPLFIISFQKNILIVEKSLLKFLHSFFITNTTINFCFLSESIKSIFNENIKFQYKELLNKHNDNNQFLQEIENFNRQMELKRQNQISIFNIWKIIRSSISGYLIKSSYLKCKYDRITSFYHTSSPETGTIKFFDKDEYIEIREIGKGGSFQINLIYLIEDEKLLVIKQPYGSNTEIPKLLDRETNNYKTIKHPFLPKFYGLTKKDEYIVIEYINGFMLSDINKFDFLKEIIFRFILQLLSAIDYLHKNDFIHRDLKPNNIMFDEFLNITVIDLDRMIKEENNDPENNTKNFSSEYAAPEIQTGKTTKKSDIYSVGKIILFLLMNIKSNSESFLNNKEIIDIYNICTNKNPKLRYSISELIKQFCIFIAQNNIEITQMTPELDYQFGNIFYENEFVPRNINKAIYYYSKAADFNHSESQYMLGLIFYQNKYISQDVNKVIYYCTNAAKQGNSKAAHILGNIYYNNKLIKRDINKAIYYYSLAGELNNDCSLVLLGIIYSSNEYIPSDINKALIYYKKSAKLKNQMAQLTLGDFYLEGTYVKQNTKKALQYYKLSANQNNVMAQLKLGVIYVQGKYVSRDIKKAIHYFEFAAKQNSIQSMYNLAIIYEEGIYIKRDIKKAIDYFTLAADQNHVDAQYYLGYLYFDGASVTKNIEKAIHYLTLAANKNHSEAQFYLGFIYSQENYISQNIRKAIYYYTLSANQNNVKSQLKLGLIYLKGKYIRPDINKAIHYLTLAANQNDPSSQYNLGLIYLYNTHIKRDINKAIKYFTLAANQNSSNAQNHLGCIYSEGKFVPRDINKAIYYYLISANQNNEMAQFNLANIYYDGKYVPVDIKKALFYGNLSSQQNFPKANILLGSIYEEGIKVKRDMNKAIYYYKLAADQKNYYAQFILGYIYEQGEGVPKDIDKAIYYYSLSCQHNYSSSQLLLGLIFYEGRYGEKYIYKGIDLIIQSSNNNCTFGQFSLAYIYQTGKYIKRNIKESIRLYKETSSLNFPYSKNNLGIIYQNGIANEVSKDLNKAKIYFYEAIKQKNNEVSMYNLAHLYIFEEYSEETFNESIQLLIKSVDKGFSPSKQFLLLILIKKYGTNFNNINRKLSNFMKNPDILIKSFKKAFEEQLLYLKQIFEEVYQQQRSIYYIYNQSLEIIQVNDLENEKNNQETRNNKNLNNINDDFYKGFGEDILLNIQ